MNSTTFHGTENRAHDVEGSSAVGRLPNPRRSSASDAAGSRDVITNSHGSMNPRHTYSTSAPTTMDAE